MAIALTCCDMTRAMSAEMAPERRLESTMYE